MWQKAHTRSVRWVLELKRTTSRPSFLAGASQLPQTLTLG